MLLLLQLLLLLVLSLTSTTDTTNHAHSPPRSGTSRQRRQPSAPSDGTDVAGHDRSLHDASGRQLVHERHRGRQQRVTSGSGGVSASSRPRWYRSRVVPGVAAIWAVTSGRPTAHGLAMD